MTIIRTRHSADELKRPPASLLREGELAANTGDEEPGVYLKTRESLVKIGPTYIGEEAPNFAGNGVADGESGYTHAELWWHPTENSLYIYHGDWIQIR